MAEVSINWTATTVDLFGAKISSKDVVGSGMAEAARRVMELIEKSHECQHLRMDPKKTVLKISQIGGVRVLVDGEKTFQRSFDEVVNAGWLTYFSPSRSGALSRAGHELYESINRAEKLYETAVAKEGLRKPAEPTILPEPCGEIKAEQLPETAAVKTLREQAARISSTVQGIIKGVVAPNPNPGLLARLRAKVEKLGCANDVHGALRNAAVAAGQVAAVVKMAEYVKPPILADMGILGLSAGLPIAAYGTIKGVDSTHEASKIGDRVGVGHSLMGMVTSIDYGVMCGAGIVATTAGLKIAGDIAGITGIVFSALVMIQGALGIYTAYQMRKKLDAILNSKADLETPQLIDALMFLKQRVMPTRAELEKVKGDEEAIRKLILKKRAQFERATSGDCYKELLVPEGNGFKLERMIKDLLSDDPTDAILQAKELLTTVYKHNNQTEVKGWISLVIGLICTIAFILDNVFLLGIVNRGFGAALAVSAAASAVFSQVNGLWLCNDSSKVQKELIHPYIWGHRKDRILPAMLKGTNDGKLSSQLIFGLKATALAVTAPFWTLPAYIWLEWDDFWKKRKVIPSALPKPVQEIPAAV